MNQVTQFLRAASAPQRERLASLAGTSVANLYQVAGGHRQASSGLAVKLDRASRRLPQHLPRIDRKRLAPGCGGCEFVRKCSK